MGVSWFLKKSLFRICFFTAAILFFLNGCDSVEVLSVEVVPANTSTPMGVGVQFQALILYSDGVKRNVSYHAEWSSSMPSVAIASQDKTSLGGVSPIARGTAVISATFNGVTGSANLTVTPAVLNSITISPAGPSVPMGIGVQFTAKGVYTDNTQVDFTDNVTWAAAPSSVVTISNADGSRGFATPTGVGSGFVTAAVNGITANSNFIVKPVSLSGITIQPTNKTIALPETQQFTAIGVYSDNTTYDITKYAMWSADTPSVATISNDSGSNGLATAVSSGTTAINATFNSTTESTNLSVAP